MFLIYLLLLDFRINSHLYDLRLKDTMKESIICMMFGEYFYPFQASVRLLYSLEILENLCFSDVFRWHRN